MKIRLEAEKIWREYEEGLSYKEGLDLFREYLFDLWD